MPSAQTSPSGALRAYRQESLVSCGVPIALSVWERRPQAATALFYPSTMASPLLHRFFLEELWRMGLNVVGLHPLSHGQSPKIKKDFTFAHILRNGLDAADWIRQRMDGPLIVTGHSQGGIFALAHAARDSRIAAAVPITTLLPQHPDAGLVTRFHRILRRRETLLAILRAGARLMPRLPVLMPFYLEINRIMAGAVEPLSDWRCLRASYPLRFICSLFTEDISDACVPGNIACPVLLITAKNDALFTLPLMRAMLDDIAAPQKKLLLIDGGGHLAPLCGPYARQIAARMAEHCAGLGLPLHDCGLAA